MIRFCQFCGIELDRTDLPINGELQDRLKIIKGGNKDG